MMQYVVRLLVNNETVDCMPLQAGSPGLGLNEDGMTWLEDAPVRIEIVQDELHIALQREIDCRIVRNGRTRRLTAGQSIRLLSGDELHIDEKVIAIQAIYKSQSTPSNTLKTASRAVMMTLAASLALTACSKITPTEQLTGDMVRNSAYEHCSKNTESPKDIEACCLKMDNEMDKRECCDMLSENHQGIYCDVLPEDAQLATPEITGLVAPPNDLEPPREPRTAIEPAEPIPDSKSQNEPQPVIVEPVLAPEIHEMPMGDYAVTPYGDCMEKNGDNPDQLKACCEAHQNEENRTSCCKELNQAHPGTVCEEKTTEIPVRRTAGKPAVIQPETSEAECDQALKTCEQKEDEKERLSCCNALKATCPDKACEEKAPVIPPRTAGVPKRPTTDTPQ